MNVRVAFIHPSSAHWRRRQNFPPNSHKLACLQATAGLAQLVEVLTAEMVVPSPVVDVKYCPQLRLDYRGKRGCVRLENLDLHFQSRFCNKTRNLAKNGLQHREMCPLGGFQLRNFSPGFT